jgi:hypothetical protein
MTLQEYEKLIARFDKAFAADKWVQIYHFKVLYDELIEKRDAAIKAKMVEAPSTPGLMGSEMTSKEMEAFDTDPLIATQDAPEAPKIAQEPLNEDDSVNPRDHTERELIEQGKELVEEFDKTV